DFTRRGDLVALLSLDDLGFRGFPTVLVRAAKQGIFPAHRGFVGLDKGNEANDQQRGQNGSESEREHVAHQISSPAIGKSPISRLSPAAIMQVLPSAWTMTMVKVLPSGEA